MDGGTTRSEAIAARWSTRARDWAPPANTAPAQDARINFDQGLPDPSLFPIDELRRCLDVTLEADGDEALRYFGRGRRPRDAVRPPRVAHRDRPTAVRT